MTQIITNTTNGNQYRLLAKVGEGAYADVFRGENLVTKEIVAVKKMKTMKASVLIYSFRTHPWPKNRCSS
jgi:serine/threonine protein kinase